MTKAIKRGRLTLDPARHDCLWDYRPVRLTVTEFLLPQSLAQRPGFVKSRDNLMDAAYDDQVYVDDRTIDSHVKRMRKKFRQVDPEFDAIDPSMASVTATARSEWVLPVAAGRSARRWRAPRSRARAADHRPQSGRPGDPGGRRPAAERAAQPGPDHARIESLRTEGQLIANVIEQTATVGDPAPAPEPDRARQTLQLWSIRAASGPGCSRERCR